MMTSLKLTSNITGVEDHCSTDHLRVRIPSYSASSTLSSASSSLSSSQVNSSSNSASHRNEPTEHLDVMVVFPNGVQINKKIDPKKAIYDLLIELTASVKLMPTHYVLRLYSHVDETNSSKNEEDRVIEYTPNQLIGPLNPAKIKILTKTATLKHHHQYQIMNTESSDEHHHGKSVTLNRNNSGKNNTNGSSQQQQPFEFKTRIEVNLPFNQKTVVRVRPDISLSDLFVIICKEACLDRELYELRIFKNNDVKSGSSGKPESMSDSYSSYNAKEVTLILKINPTNPSNNSKNGTHSMFAKFRGGGSSSSKSSSLKKKSSAEIFLSKKSATSHTLSAYGSGARDKSKSELDLRYNMSIREEDEIEMSRNQSTLARHPAAGGSETLNKSIMDISNSISKKSTTSKNSSSLFNFFTRRKSKESKELDVSGSSLSKSKLSLNTIDYALNNHLAGSHIDLSTTVHKKPIIARPLSTTAENLSLNDKTFSSATTALINRVKKRMAPPPPVQSDSNKSVNAPATVSTSNKPVMSQQELEKIKQLSKAKNKKAPLPPPLQAPSQPKANTESTIEPNQKLNEPILSNIISEKVVNNELVCKESVTNETKKPTERVQLHSDCGHHNSSSSSASPPSSPRSSFPSPSLSDVSSSFRGSGGEDSAVVSRNTKLVGSIVTIHKAKTEPMNEITPLPTQMSTFTVAKIIKNSLVMPVASNQTIQSETKRPSPIRETQTREDIKVNIISTEIVSIQTEALSPANENQSGLVSSSSASSSSCEVKKEPEEEEEEIVVETRIITTRSESNKPTDSTISKEFVQVSKTAVEGESSSEEEASNRSVVIRTVNDSFRSNISSSESCASSASSSKSHNDIVTLDVVKSNETTSEVKQQLVDNQTAPIIPPREDLLLIKSIQKQSSEESELEMNISSSETPGTYRLLAKRTAVIETAPEYSSATIFVPPLPCDESTSPKIETQDAVNLSRQNSSNSSSSSAAQSHHFPAYEEKELNEQHANFMVKRTGEIIEKNGVYFSHDGSVRGYPGIVKKFAQSRTLKEIFVKQQELDTRREQCSSDDQEKARSVLPEKKPVMRQFQTVTTPVANTLKSNNNNNFSAYRRSQPTAKEANIKTELENELSRKLELRRQVISDQMKNADKQEETNKLKSSFQTKPEDTINNQRVNHGTTELTTTVLHTPKPSSNHHHVNKSSPSFVMSAKSKLDHHSNSNARSSLLSELKSVVPLIEPIDSSRQTSTPSAPSSPPLPPPPPFLTESPTSTSPVGPVSPAKPIVAPKNFSSNAIKSLNSKTQVLNARDNLMESIKSFQFGSLKRATNLT